MKAETLERLEELKEQLQLHGADLLDATDALIVVIEAMLEDAER